MRKQSKSARGDWIAPLVLVALLLTGLLWVRLDLRPRILGDPALSRAPAAVTGGALQPTRDDRP